MKAVKSGSIRITWLNKEHYDSLADKVVYTGTIDSLFTAIGYGKLQYRSLKFENRGS